MTSDFVHTQVVRVRGAGIEVPEFNRLMLLQMLYALTRYQMITA